MIFSRFCGYPFELTSFLILAVVLGAIVMQSGESLSMVLDELLPAC